MPVGLWFVVLALQIPPAAHIVSTDAETAEDRYLAVEPSGLLPEWTTWALLPFVLGAIAIIDGRYRLHFGEVRPLSLAVGTNVLVLGLGLLGGFALLDPAFIAWAGAAALAWGSGWAAALGTLLVLAPFGLRPSLRTGLVTLVLGVGAGSLVHLLPNALLVESGRSIAALLTGVAILALGIFDHRSMVADLSSARELIAGTAERSELR